MRTLLRILASVLPLVLWTSVAMAQGWLWPFGDDGPFAPGNNRREEDRANLSVDCGRMDEFVKKKEFIVDGEPVMRWDIADAKYATCLKERNPKAPWKVLHTQWSAEHERGFGEFIQRLGRSQCKTVDTCMISASANPFRSEEDMAAFHYSDCADFPMYLRGYYAYKNNLPFSYLSGLNQRAPFKNFLYTPEGNLPAKRTSAVGRNVDFFRWASRLVDVYHSGMLRMSNWEQGDPAGTAAPDYYSPALTPGSIRPGTVVYDSQGHVAIVYEISPTGEIKLVQASPGGSVSYSILDSTFQMSKPVLGAGFKNWRPFRITGAQRNSEGEIVGGNFTFAKDHEIADFSMEQYLGHEPDKVMASGEYDASKVRYLQQGWRFKRSEYVRFIRVRFLPEGKYLEPVVEFNNALKNFCTTMVDKRMPYVSSATEKGVANQPAPELYPDNIYNSTPTWENFSSPGGDARYKRMIERLMAELSDYWWKMYKSANPPPFFRYTGGDLKVDLERVFHRRNYECRVSYVNSKGQVIELTLADVLGRMSLLSFDPYHCIERRWGAPTRTEAKTCKDDGEKTAWYNATQFLRNVMDRPEKFSTKMSLQQMQQFVAGKPKVLVDGYGEVSTKNTSDEYDVLKVVRGLQ